MTQIYLDLETLPDQRPGAYDKILAEIRPPATYKKAESIANWFVEYGVETAKEQYHKTGLNGISGEICSIAWAVDDSAICSSCRNTKITEAELLQFFFEVIARETKIGEGEHPRLTWIGHNVLDFDLRFLKQRAIICNVMPPFIIPADARHGSSQVFDTMKNWCGNYRIRVEDRFVSQQALCEALGIEGKSGMDGKDVWPAYQRGEYDKIAEYNRNDVRIVRELYKRMSWA